MSYEYLKYYEIHITVHLPPNKARENLYKHLAKAEGWKTFKSDGDPLLGAGIKFYFTRHSKTENAAYSDLNAMTDVLRDNYVKILREKIEHIIFDTKSNVGTLLK